MSANPVTDDKFVDAQLHNLSLDESQTDLKQLSNISASNKKYDILERIKILRLCGIDVTPDKDGGILKMISVLGLGSNKPLPGDEVVMEYRRWLVDGSVIDEGYKSFEFQFGESKTIALCEHGIGTMLEGEVALFLCRPCYGLTSEELLNGAHQEVDIVFEIKLISWHGCDGDLCVCKSAMESGESYGIPNDGAKCTVELIGRYKGRIFDERVVTFIHGEGMEEGVVEGVEQALLRFSRGEKARLKLKSRVGFGEHGCEKFAIPPNADLEYDVRLLECSRAKDFWDMTLEEKLEQSKQDKLKGLHYFQQRKFKLAIKFFQKIIDYLQFEDLNAGMDQEVRRDLLLSSYLNLAICHLSEDQPFPAAHACTRAIEIDPCSEKAYFRRGIANTGMKNFKEALNDFQKVTLLNPKNKGAVKKLKLAETSMKNMQAVERERMKKLFKRC
ncbi:hypothetical protein HELRODRAFT_63586 [Helobdella robusta]|uniref:peptidylprolyl isomerase n=1 Tax=Helobdella robusta TaxID=6412 RepID=T1FXH8_HELRO|nr:hypothetical protein HELRODRAFT_63586 [Helobdella robusta]ESO13091.1 hypothetical protein HELRODRAFT_63586 [Helobdella robusta]